MAKKVCKRARSPSPSPIRSPKKPKTITDTPRRVALQQDAIATAGKLPRKQLFKKHGIPERTGYDILKSGTARRSERIHNRGRKPLLDQHEREAIETVEDSSFHFATLPHREVADLLGLAKGSERAIQQNMKDHGVGTFRANQLKALSKQTKEKRGIFGWEKRYWKISNLKKYRYCDESHFATHLQRQALVHRRTGKKARNKATKIQHRHKRRNQVLHVFGLIGWNWKGPLHFYEGSGAKGRMTKGDFVEILEVVVKPIWKKHWVLFEDNDASHGTRGPRDNLVKKAKKRLGIKWQANIPSSPDFNPIERIWRIIKQRLKSRGLITTKEDLRRAIEEEWAKISKGEINEAIRNSLKAYQTVRHNGGEMTGY